MKGCITLCALPLPVESIVRAWGGEYIFGSTELESTLVAVFCPFAIINPIVVPIALDECVCDGISPVVNTCVSSPPLLPNVRAVNALPVPDPMLVRPLVSGILNVVVAPP
jgi:hypothetical protein